MGPRALGNRSLLASPFDRVTNEHLNRVKQREGYRPIAPCCRIEDAGKVFDTDFHDPYMLYFRRVKVPYLEAVTHVDGSARAQTVTREGNRPLHDLLSVFAERHGVGVLCNTSLNYKGTGFINKMSDLAKYCEDRGVDDMVVGDAWFQRTRSRLVWEQGPVPSRFVRGVIEQNVPAGGTVLVMAEGLDEMLEVESRRGWHFPCNPDGSFRGEHPADSDEAIAMLEEQRAKGASYLAIPASQLWWLEEYPGLQDHLEERYRAVLRDDGCLIFALDGNQEQM
jgi:Carbamoyltransferase C-terminus